MSHKLLILTFAVGLAACSQGNQTQTPAQADKASAPASASSAAPAQAQAQAQPSTPQPAAPQADKPESVPPAAAAAPALEKPAQATPPAQPAAPSATETAAAAAAATPQFREVTIPVGTPLSVALKTPVASDASRVEDEVHGTLTTPLVIDGVTAVPAGAEVVGTVRAAKRSGRVKGRASIAFQFERLIVRREPLTIRTATVSRQAAANRREDVKKGAIGAAAGAIVGAIAGGGKGAAIGAGAGGTGAVLVTRGEEVRLAAGTIVRTTLQRPLKVLVPHSSR